MTVRKERPPAGGRSPMGPLLGMLLGAVGAAVSLGVAELVAAITGPSTSPIIAVGGATIDAVPMWLKSFAIRTFGTQDKTALMVGIGVILAGFAISIGIVTLRRRAIGFIGLAVFGAIGVAAAVSRPGATIAAALPSVVGAGAGTGAMTLLYLTGSRFRRARPAGPAHPATRRSGPSAAGSPGPILDRRRFLAGSTALGVAAVAAGIGGRALARRRFAGAASRSQVRIPRPSSPARPLPPGAELHVPGLEPFYSTNATFYRIDTALFVPSVPAETWKLRIHGMVDRQVEIDYADLLRRPLIERDVTLTCVSNEVGGPYIGTARWIGASLKALLDEAGVRAGATQLVSRSTDGMTIGSPTAVVMDGRDAMLAVAMNGQPLPLAHGFPVRMVVPGLYGYVSATKWVVDLELTTFEAFDPYWIQRGWARPAPIKTESRIGVPRSGVTVPRGTVQVAGVAWAQHRGIERVEVRVDKGPWQPAKLADQDTIDTWRQWVFAWDATAGEHTVQVRATDDTGAVQAGAEADPFPSGATGWHSVFVTIS